MNSTGWKASNMPMVFWSVSEDGLDNPQRYNDLDAEVELPNGQKVMVTEVRYQGITVRYQGITATKIVSGNKLREHRFQGRLK